MDEICARSQTLMAGLPESRTFSARRRRAGRPPVQPDRPPFPQSRRLHDCGSGHSLRCETGDKQQRRFSTLPSSRLDFGLNIQPNQPRCANACSRTASQEPKAIYFAQCLLYSYQVRPRTSTPLAWRILSHESVPLITRQGTMVGSGGDGVPNPGSRRRLPTRKTSCPLSRTIRASTSV